MEYRGYTGVADYDPRDEIFYGHVANLDTTVTFEAVTAQRLYWEFRKAVDGYIESLRACEEVPQPPRRPIVRLDAGGEQESAVPASAGEAGDASAATPEPEAVLQQAAA